MPEKVDVTSEAMEKIRRAASEFKDSVAGFFRDYKAEMKDWRFAVENSEQGALVDVSVKVLIKPKSSNK